MLLSMVPLFGTAGQHLMYDIHRYAALVLMVLTLWHAYITTLAKPGGLTAVLRGRVTSGWARLYHPLWGGASEETGEAAEESDSEETPAD
jgi:cytochrome b subunit of formate dehydrogenase